MNVVIPWNYIKKREAAADVAQHFPFMELVLHPRSLVHVEDDLHAALHRLRQHKGVERSNATLPLVS
jgi:hypothetical protein